MRYINVENLIFYYDREPVLENISYHVDSGEFVTLTGENGAAKSTLIKTTLGILKPKKGKIKISPKNNRGEKLRIAYLPQQVASFNAGFPSSVHEFVMSGRYPRQGWFKKMTAHDSEHVKAALDSVGMWDYRNKRIGELSGGQKQRIAIARMFASDPDLFMKDYADRNIHLLKDKNGKFACFDLHTDRDRVAQERQQELKEETDV